MKIKLTGQSKMEQGVKLCRMDHAMPSLGPSYWLEGTNVIMARLKAYKLWRLFQFTEGTILNFGEDRNFKEVHQAITHYLNQTTPEAKVENFKKALEKL